MKRILSDLNDQQRQACRSAPEPVLVLAGPGTGKTRLLIARIVWTIRQNMIPPENILALTFTNKAAHEIKQRLASVDGIEADKVWTGTIHGFAFQMIRKYHDRVGLDRHFTVCDSVYQNHLVAELCAPYIRENLAGKVKGILLSFSHHTINGRNLPPFAAERYAEYTRHLNRHNLIDFDQILVKCLDLMTGHQDILSQYRHKYRAVLIDEFQDTDAVQYKILKQLAEAHKNIFVVADDDQSIYTWRGASPENIRQFMQDFQIIEPKYLKLNYRSGARIIDAATRIIEKTERLASEKPVEITDPGTEDVSIHFFNSEKQEIDFLISSIDAWHARGVDFRDIAVIYPYHRIGQSMEQFFLKGQIPYQMARGQSVLEHPSVKKLILYLRLTLDPEDHIALEQLTEQETGQQLFDMIKTHAHRLNIGFRKSLYAFYRNDDRRIGRDLSSRIQRFVMQLANLINLRDFFRFDQYMFDIYQYISDTNDSTLEAESEQLQQIDHQIRSDNALASFDSSLPYRIHHPDPRICFLAAKLLGCLGVKYDPADDTAQKYLALIEKDDADSDPACIPLYKLKDTHRQGSLGCLFKFLQWHLTDDASIGTYVVFDLETTDKDPESCDIVEIAAVRVQNGRIVAELESLIKPEKPIHPAAQAVHGINAAQLQDKPGIEEFWPVLREFIGDNILIAHNGYKFDFPIIDRVAKAVEGKRLNNPRFDTLVLARNLFPGTSNSIDSLMARYNLTSDNRHRALEDVQLLNNIFIELQKDRLARARNVSFEMFLDIVSLGGYIENKISEPEDRLFFISGARKLITPYTRILEDFCKRFDLDQKELAGSIKDQLETLQPGSRRFSQDENSIVRLREMAARFNHLPVREAIAGFLGELALQQAQDDLNDINAVSLLTYHAAKGLEFDKVILVGLEEDSMPGFYASRRDEEDERPLTKKMEEQRRLLYVGMTRAKSELVMTAVRNRGGWERKSSPFLKDIRQNVKIKNEI